MLKVVLTDQINTKLMESTSAMTSKETKSKDQLFLMELNLDDTTNVWPCDHNSFFDFEFGFYDPSIVNIKVGFPIDAL